ncbi:MAG: hypothetical protein AAF433_10900 [Bacteroidota bacterium]
MKNSILLLSLLTLLLGTSCDDDEMVIPAGDILVRVNNLLGENISELEIGFFGYDNLQTVGAGQLAAGAVSEFRSFMEGGSCDFNIRFRDANGTLQESCTPCECICLIDEGNYEATVSYAGFSGTVIQLGLQEIE